MILNLEKITILTSLRSFPWTDDLLDHHHHPILDHAFHPLLPARPDLRSPRRLLLHRQRQAPARWWYRWLCSRNERLLCRCSQLAHQGNQLLYAPPWLFGAQERLSNILLCSRGKPDGRVESERVNLLCIAMLSSENLLVIPVIGCQREEYIRIFQPLQSAVYSWKS